MIGIFASGFTQKESVSGPDPDLTPPPRVHTRADYTRFIRQCRAVYDMGYHMCNRKSGGGRGGRKYYLGHTRWSYKWCGHISQGQGGQLVDGEGYRNYTRCGQVHGRGCHGRGSGRHYGGHTRNGGACGSQGYPPNPAHTQDGQFQKWIHQDHQYGVMLRWLARKGGRFGEDGNIDKKFTRFMDGDNNQKDNWGANKRA